MIDVRTAGSEIFTDRKPRKFYAFCGTEYGVKLKFIRSIKEIYGKTVNLNSVQAAMTMLNAVQLIPLEPTLYLIRYDADFIKSLDDTSEFTIDGMDYEGTIIVMYESEQDFKKCEKFIPNYTVRIDPVSYDFMRKYLRSDFPDLDGQRIETALKVGHSYIGAYMACQSLSNLDSSYVNADAVGRSISQDAKTNAEQFKNGVAARDFKYAVSALESSESDPYQLVYAVLSTMLEIEKCLDNPKSKSWCSKYASGWTKYDVITVFQNAYAVLKDSRLLLSYDVKSALIRILASMRFSPAVSVR